MKISPLYRTFTNYTPPAFDGAFKDLTTACQASDTNTKASEVEQKKLLIRTSVSEPGRLYLERVWPLFLDGGCPLRARRTEPLWNRSSL